MTNARKTTAIALGLLAISLVAIVPPVDANPMEATEDDQCPIVALLLYFPYVSVQPECITVPPNFP